MNKCCCEHTGKALLLHNQAPLIDLHADTFSFKKDTSKFVDGWPKRHLDLPRMLEIGIWAEAFSLFVYPKWAAGEKAGWLSLAEHELDNIHTAIENSGGKMALAVDANEVLSNLDGGAVSAIIEIEGLHALGGDIAKIEKFFERGVRIFTLTWNNSNNWATSCMDDDAETRGLTLAGRDAVAEINRLGGLVDFSHSGERTFWDSIDIIERPPICTHSCCRAIKDSSRNLTDDQIAAIIERGGVIGINFFPGFLSKNKYSKVTAADIADHIEHILELGGEKNVGLGSDFDGISHLPVGIDDCTGIITITEELLARGHDDGTIMGILGRNFLRVF